MTDMTKCPQGITIAAWMRFHGFENNMVYLSTGENGFLMKHQRDKLEVSVDGKGTVVVPLK